MPTKPEIEATIREVLSANNSPGYGITVADVSTDPPTIDVDIHFLSGCTYCCAEPGCHLPHDLSLLPALSGFTIHWHFRVEQGARLKSNAPLGLPLESAGYEFEFVTGMK
jgi:hypothetical protein